MANCSSCGGLAFVMLLVAGPALAQPRIIDSIDARACQPAFALAKLAFESPAPLLANAAPAILNGKRPPAFGILLAPDGDTREDASFIVDERMIEQKDVRGTLKAMYLERAQAVVYRRDRFRFVVTRQKMNWQGDWYGLYLADVKLEAEALAELLGPEKVTGAKVVFDRAWQRPWLLRYQDGIVGIDTQHPANFLADWIVYKPGGGAVTVACRIAFRPPVEHAALLLPAGPLRELATLLDAIVGVPAQDEGTYQATGRVRLVAMQAWANAALRPWAMAEPYNTPAEIERGLKAWSSKSAAFGAQYSRVHALYPRALAALAAHYSAALHEPPAAAAALAKRALDHAVGAHFVFPKGT